MADAASPPCAVSSSRAGRRYAELADRLISAIRDGTYPVGTHIPTEAELCRQFRMSRSTIRQALQIVESAGLIERRQGSGTKVIAVSAPVRYVLSLATEADILRYAAEAVFEVAGPPTRPSYVDARRLALGDPTQWRFVTGVRRESGLGPPIGLTTVYLPTKYVDAIEDVRLYPQQALFSLVIRRNGLTLDQIEQQVTATVLAEREANVLAGQPGGPALLITRRFSSVELGVIEVSESIHPADRFVYMLRLDRENARDQRAATATLAKPPHQGA
jgi:GntR family transcriptional regulator